MCGSRLPSQTVEKESEVLLGGFVANRGDEIQERLVVPWSALAFSESIQVVSPQDRGNDGNGVPVLEQ